MVSVVTSFTKFPSGNNVESKGCELFFHHILRSALYARQPTDTGDEAQYFVHLFFTVERR